MPAAEVLRFRDNAFHDYFASPDYLEMVNRKFGLDTRRHIEEMTQTRLRRKLLEGSNGEGNGSNGAATLRPATPPESSAPFSILSA